MPVYVHKQSIASDISSFSCLSGELLWDMRPVYFLSGFSVLAEIALFHVCFILAVEANSQSLGESAMQASSRLAMQSMKVSTVSHTGIAVSHQKLLAIWSSRYQKSQYLHFVEYACPPVFGKRVIWSLLVWLSCLHSQDTICKSSNDSETTLYEVSSLLGLIHCYSKLNGLSIFLFFNFR